MAQPTPAPDPAPANVANVEDDPTRPYKAIAATLAPLALMLIGFLWDSSDGGHSITSTEWGTLIAAALGSGVITHRVKNPKRAKR